MLHIYFNIAQSYLRRDWSFYVITECNLGQEAVIFTEVSKYDTPLVIGCLHVQGKTDILVLMEFGVLS